MSNEEKIAEALRAEGARVIASIRGPAVQVQPRPRGLGVAVFPLVRADLNARERIGVETYGESLRTLNGRDMLVDAYQEAIDLAVYLRGEIAERDEIGDEMQALRGELQTYRKIAAECVAQANTYRSAIVDMIEKEAAEREARGFTVGPFEAATCDAFVEGLRAILNREAESFTLAEKLKAWRAEILTGLPHSPRPPTGDDLRLAGRISSILGEDVLP